MAKGKDNSRNNKNIKSGSKMTKTTKRTIRVNKTRILKGGGPSNNQEQPPAGGRRRSPPPAAGPASPPPAAGPASPPAAGPASPPAGPASAAPVSAAPASTAQVSAAQASVAPAPAELPTFLATHAHFASLRANAIRRELAQAQRLATQARDRQRQQHKLRVAYQSSLRDWNRVTRQRQNLERNINRMPGCGIQHQPWECGIITESQEYIANIERNLEMERILNKSLLEHIQKLRAIIGFK